MSTKDKHVAQNLLKYRYNQLDKAIENASKLGFKNGAALYPMVTMNGEECHNEWEITFEEIHRNEAMLYAIYNYVNYTGDYQYIPTIWHGSHDRCRSFLGTKSHAFQSQKSIRHFGCNRT